MKWYLYCITYHWLLALPYTWYDQFLVFVWCQHDLHSLVDSVLFQFYAIVEWQVLSQGFRRSPPVEQHISLQFGYWRGSQLLLLQIHWISRWQFILPALEHNIGTISSLYCHMKFYSFSHTFGCFLEYVSTETFVVLKELIWNHFPVGCLWKKISPLCDNWKFRTHWEHTWVSMLHISNICLSWCFKAWCAIGCLAPESLKSPSPFSYLRDSYSTDKCPILWSLLGESAFILWIHGFWSS